MTTQHRSLWASRARRCRPNETAAHGRRDARLGRHHQDADRRGTHSAAAWVHDTTASGRRRPRRPRRPRGADREPSATAAPALIGGTIVLLIGLWFFATTTLGLDLPRIDWRQSWPVILIVVGLLILLRAFRRSPLTR